MTAWQRYPPLFWRAEKAYFPVSLVMDKRLCQFACKVTYFFTHAQARERNIARFSVANVCRGGLKELEGLEGVDELDGLEGL